ncbi:16210_t:CDS:1, partial [Acaulospora colombiana]
MIIANLNTFLEFQHIFHLTDNDRTDIMKEIMKQKLNYSLHIPWDKLEILTDEKQKTFILNRKTKTPLPSPNTPAPIEERIDHDMSINNNTMQLDSSPATIPASTPDPVSPLDNINPCDYEITN